MGVNFLRIAAPLKRIKEPFKAIENHVLTALTKTEATETINTPFRMYRVTADCLASRISPFTGTALFVLGKQNPVTEFTISIWQLGNVFQWCLNWSV